MLRHYNNFSIISINLSRPIIDDKIKINIILSNQTKEIVNIYEKLINPPYDFHYYNDPALRILEKSIELSAINDEQLGLQIHDKKLSTINSLYFTLSTDPQVALNWLGALCYNFKFQISSDGVAVNVSGKPVFSPDKRLTSKIFLGLLLLKNSTAQDIYAPVMNALQKMYYTFVEDSKHGFPPSFHEYLEIENRCHLLFPEIIHNFFDGNFKEKEEYLLTLGRNLILNHQKREFSFILRSLHYVGLKKLYEVAFSSKATYTCSNTLWYFLSHCETYLRQDGSLSIININKNKGYIKYCADQRYSFYQAELEHFFKIISLELKPDSDYRNELIFTEKCTQEKLMPLGLHITENSIKNLLRRKHLTQLFFYKPNKIDSKDINIIELFPHLKESIVNYILK